MWVNLNTQETFEYHWEIRANHPGTSLPEIMDDALISSLGYSKQKVPTPPAINVEELRKSLKR